MEGDLYYCGILIICLLASAVFSLAETALTTVPETYIRKVIEEKRGFTKPFKLWLKRPNGVLTAIIVGNNLFNTLAAVVATVFAQRLFQHYVISIATGAVTIALLIFGEITPKTFARHNARAVLQWAIYIVYPVYILLFPVVWVLTHLAMWLVKMMGGHVKREGPVATEEDIAYLIRLSHEEGVFKPEQGMMLQSVITFRKTSAREIMVPRTNMFTLASDASLEEVTSQIAQHGFTRWPVYSDDIDHVIGVFHVKDLISFQHGKEQHFILKDHLRKAIFIPESMKLDDALREFQRKKVHLAIVVDEYGGTAGLVTLEDILEEIVGEIRDEYDREDEEQTIRKMGPDYYIADGHASIADIKRVCGIDLPEDESYETLGGCLTSAFGKIPKKNAEYFYQSFKLRMAEVEEKRVVKVEITKAGSDVKK